MASQDDLFAPVQDDNIVLTPVQSLALRRMIEAMKADDAIYSACPDVVRTAIADLAMPSFTSAEEQIIALEEARAGDIRMMEKLAARIRELEGKLSRRAA